MEGSLLSSFVPSRDRLIALLLVGTIIACHGIFGSAHLCPAPQLSGNHVHEHPSSTEKGASTHQHPGCHLVHAAEYFAVLLVAFLGLFLELVLKGARLWGRGGTPLIFERRGHLFGLPPPRGLTASLTQVFRL